MQNSSSNFSAAASGATRVLTGARVRADWNSDGSYGGAYDDLTKQTGPWSVSHHLDDGLPDQVSFVAGLGTAELDAEVTGRWVSGIGPMNAARYWSPMSTESPIYGIERDIPPMQVDVGLVTSGGQEYVTVFKGQMADAPVQPGGRVQLAGMSAARLALAKLIHPPGILAFSAGCNATWLVSWALYQCGIYTSPPPRSGVRWHAPMHGSLTPFLPSDFVVEQPFPANFQRITAFDGTTDFNLIVPEWVTGPYLLAPAIGLDTVTHRQVGITGIRLGDGTDLMSRASSKGRFEFWIQGNSSNVNLAPQGSGGVTKLSGIELLGTDAAWYAKMGVGTDRKVFVTVNDGAGHIATLKSTDTLPTDGAWYFVGAAYDVSAQKMWVTNFNGTTGSTGYGFVTTSLPATDAWADQTNPAVLFSPWWVAWLPSAEIHLTSGAQANVDSFPTWLNGVSWTQGAVVTPSPIELTGLAEKVPREAWELIGSVAQAELAMLRTDETDQVLYLGQGWFVEDEQQVFTPMLATDWNTARLGVERDLSKIRNAVRVSYADASNTPRPYTTVYQNTSVITLLPGLTILTVTFQDPAMDIYGNNMDLYDEVDLTNTLNFLSGSITNYISVNTAEDGSGTYITDRAIVAPTIVSWDPSGAVLYIVNSASDPYFLANDVGQPTIAMAGHPLVAHTTSVTQSDVASIAVRGERGLAVDAQFIQRYEDAVRLARRIKMALRKPVNVIKGVKVIGDPRRQPGDLVHVMDDETGASGDWRIQTIDHSGDGAKYTQSVTIRPALPICIVGEGIVGASLVGPGS